MASEKKFEKIISNIVPDILDNFAYNEELPIFENKNTENVDKVMYRLLTEDQRKRLLDFMDGLEDGRYEYLSLVGEKDNGTLHPHLFVVEKRDGVVKLNFVDPEHNVGNQNLLRPKISNLMAINVPEGKDSVPELVILRFATEGLFPDDLKLKNQSIAASQLIDREGIPEMLVDFPKNILFRLVVKKIGLTLQARYTNTKKATDFLAGGDGSRALRGKVRAEQYLVERFIKFLEEGHFKLSERFTKTFTAHS